MLLSNGNWSAPAYGGNYLKTKRNEKEMTVYGFLLFLESIPLPKVCASHIEKILSKTQKHDKMDGAEKLLSISHCPTTVVYSVTVVSVLGRKHSSF